MRLNKRLIKNIIVGILSFFGVTIGSTFILYLLKGEIQHIRFLFLINGIGLIIVILFVILLEVFKHKVLKKY